MVTVTAIVCVQKRRSGPLQQTSTAEPARDVPRMTIRKGSFGGARGPIRMA